MAFNEIEQRRIQKEMQAFLERKRPPPHIRPELDIGYRMSGQSIEIFEMRPHWQDRTRIMESPVAKATFVKTRRCWKIFWMRADLKWHCYEPRGTVRHLSEFLAEVETDPYACFWG
ncbi:MAG TPA: DUF3024 domain-containing protein [Gammaproteobacteria bacterium]